MDGRGHRRVGLATAIGLTIVAPLPPAAAAVSVFVAWATAGGGASPDLDLDPDWKRADRVLPDEILGGGGPLGHRRITHFVGWPVLAWLLWRHHPVTDPTWAVGFFRGMWVGWTTHVAMDWLFGAGGVPWLLWTGRWGLELDQDGILARIVSRAALTASIAAGLWLAWTTAHLPIPKIGALS
jgi:hypothetical protein